MANFYASTTSDVIKFVGLAKDGDQILLAAGTYSGVSMQNVVKAGNVTIASADALRPAVLTDLTVKNSQGLTFKSLEMFAKADVRFAIESSSRINLDQLDVHGTLNGSSNDDFRGMLVRNSSNVTVTNSYFHELTDALNHINNQQVTFSGNRFNLIRDNGIAGGGSSFLTIANNSFTNFDHVGPVHPDAIQNWTTNTKVSATDITITGNVFNRGNGSVVQGIFIQDEVGNLPYQRVTVSDNVIVGAAFHGINVSGAVDAKLTNNTVIGYEDQTSWIGVTNVKTATLSGNIATAWNFINSAVTGRGDVQATSLTLADAASAVSALVPVAKASTLSATTSASQFKAWTLSEVALLGYTDGAPISGPAQTFQMVQVDGTAANDTLKVAAIGSYRLKGYDGNDTLAGGKTGTSVLEGGKGDDSYTIYQALDGIVELAGEGTDTVYSHVSYTLANNVENLRAMASGITLKGNALDNTIAGATGGDVLYGEGGNDLIQGVDGVDTMYGGLGNDRLLGGNGDDKLWGDAGNDSLQGGDGNDTMLGGDGIDVLEGNAGADILTGGLGADTFLLRPGDFGAGLATSQDTITDFSVSQGDKINLSLLDANMKTTANEAFNFIGSQAFHGVAGELRYAAVSGGITVYADTNGDKLADFQVHLTGLNSITSSSFML